MRVLLLLILLIPSSAFALTTVTRYVNTTCANNGDGTASSCAASGGAAGAYNSGSNSASDLSSDYPDLTSSDVVITVNLAGSTADAQWQIGPSITTDSTRYIQFVGNNTSGIYDTSKYHIVSTSGDECVNIRIANARFYQLQCDQQNDGGEGFRFNNEVTGTVILAKNIIQGDSSTGGNGIRKATSAGATVKIANNVIYGFDIGMFLSTSDNDAFYVYNNTVIGGDLGVQALFYGATDTAKFRGNVIQGSASSDYATESSATLTTAQNITEDATSPDGGSWQTIALTFNNAAGNDYHLVSGDTEAIDACSDLSADSDFAFSDDIDGTTRTGSWDCGADEYGTSGGGSSAVPAILLNDN